jgi:hypothetical protein
MMNDNENPTTTTIPHPCNLSNLNLDTVKESGVMHSLNLIMTIDQHDFWIYLHIEKGQGGTLL